MNRQSTRALLGVLAAAGIFVGAWALLAPGGFYNEFPGAGFDPWVATDGPYNEHLIRDIGALNLALAAASVAAAFARATSVTPAVGLAWLVYSVPHLAYHAGHLGGLAAADAIGQTASLALPVALGIALLVPRRRAPRTGTEGADR